MVQVYITSSKIQRETSAVLVKTEDSLRDWTCYVPSENVSFMSFLHVSLHNISANIHHWSRYLLTNWFKPLWFLSAVSSVALYFCYLHILIHSPGPFTLTHIFPQFPHFFISSLSHIDPIIFGGSKKTQPITHEPTSSADFTQYCFGIGSSPYFCESQCHSWSVLQMKLTRNFYYSRTVK